MSKKIIVLVLLLVMGMPRASAKYKLFFGTMAIISALAATASAGGCAYATWKTIALNKALKDEGLTPEERQAILKNKTVHIILACSLGVVGVASTASAILYAYRLYDRLTMNDVSVMTELVRLLSIGTPPTREEARANISGKALEFYLKYLDEHEALAQQDNLIT